MCRAHAEFGSHCHYLQDPAANQGPSGAVSQRTAVAKRSAGTPSSAESWCEPVRVSYRGGRPVKCSSIARVLKRAALYRLVAGLVLVVLQRAQSRTVARIGEKLRSGCPEQRADTVRDYDRAVRIHRLMAWVAP